MSELIIQEYERAGKIEGYTYLILDYKERVIASGYYHFKKQAEYYGNLALSTMKEN